MRTEHSFFNMLATTIPNLILPILGFVKFSLFSSIYGSSINGLYSTLLQIMAVLNLVEGGFGMAFQQILYKPLADKNHKKVTELYNGAVYLFRWMGIIILVLGTIIGIVSPLFISKADPIPSGTIYLIYFLLLIPVVISYFLMGPNIVVQSDQQYYKINIGIQFITFIRSVLVVVLALLKVDLAIVLLVDGLLTIATYVYSRQKSLKLYPYLKNNHEERDLSALENTKHVFAHKISGVVLSNTDPILLSVFVATSVTNIYNAYNLICSSLQKILFSIVQAPIDSFGNLFSNENEEHKYATFLEYTNFAFFLSSVICSILFVVMRDFMMLWMKEEQYILSLFAVLLFSVNLFYLVSREPLLVVRNVNGLFKETKKIAYITAIANLLISLVLIKNFGITGILLGTFLSQFIFDFFMTVNLVYPRVFNLSPWYYYRLVLGRIGIMFVIGSISYMGWKLVFPSGTSSILVWFLGSAVLGTIVLIAHSILYFVFFNEFRLFVNRAKRIVLKK